MRRLMKVSPMKAKWLSFVGLLALAAPAVAQNPNSPNSAQYHAIRNPNSPYSPYSNAQQPSQSSATMYGAIAVGAGDTLFFLNKSLDQGGAEQAALEACRQEEGAQCRLLASYQHTGNVMAVGRGESGGWYWNAASPITAKMGIRKYCKKQGASCKSTKVLAPGLGANRIKKYTLTADGSKK